MMLPVRLTVKLSCPASYCGGAGAQPWKFLLPFPKRTRKPGQLEPRVMQSWRALESRSHRTHGTDCHPDLPL